MKRRVLSLLLFSLAIPCVASAQAPSANASSAEELFQHGKVLLAKGQAAAACPLLAESYRLDPAGGTLQNLAICYEDIGRWATAYARFQELKAFSKNADPPRLDRVKLADEHLALLAPKLAHVVIVMGDVKDATVTIDGGAAPKASWSSGVPVDPGPHDVAVSAPEREPFHATVKAEAVGGRIEVVVPASPPSASGGARPETRPHDNAPRSADGWDTTGLVVGAAGLAVLVTGGVFGVLASGKNSEGKDTCSAAANPTAPRDHFDSSGRCFDDTTTASAANALKDDATTFANVANVLVPLGLIAAGVGVYLVATRRAAATDRAALPFVLRGLNGASVGGAF